LDAINRLTALSLSGFFFFFSGTAVPIWKLVMRIIVWKVLKKWPM